MYCEICEVKIGNEDKFCWNCGTEFTDDIIIQAIEYKDVEKHVKIDTTGSKIIPNYCAKCGSRLASVSGIVE